MLRQQPRSTNNFPAVVSDHGQTDAVDSPSFCSRSSQTDPLPKLVSCVSTNSVEQSTQTGLNASVMDKFTDMELTNRDLLWRKVTKETLMNGGDDSCRFYTGHFHNKYDVYPLMLSRNDATQSSVIRFAFMTCRPILIVY